MAANPQLIRRRGHWVLQRGVGSMLNAGGKAMQFRFIPALLVFLGSYFPLSLILAIQDISNDSWSSGICTDWRSCEFPTLDHSFLSLSILVVTALCLGLTFGILTKIRYKYPVRVVEAKPIPSEIISYSFPYIVAFMGVDYGSPGKLAGLILFFTWLFLITFKSGQIILNPILLIFGWNLYEAKVLVNGHARTARVLSKSKLIPGEYQCEVIQDNYITKGGRAE